MVFCGGFKEKPKGKPRFLGAVPSEDTRLDADESRPLVADLRNGSYGGFGAKCSQCRAAEHGIFVDELVPVPDESP